MKALVGLLAACVVFFATGRSAPAQVVFSFGSGYCSPSYYPWYCGYFGYPGYAYYSYYPSYYGYGWGGYYRPWWRHRRSRLLFRLEREPYRYVEYNSRQVYISCLEISSTWIRPRTALLMYS